MSSSIEEIQKRIAELQNLQKWHGIAQQPTVSSTSTDLKAMIREVLREELESMKNSTLVEAEPVVTPQPELTLIDSVNLCLEDDEKYWIAKPEVFNKVESSLSRYFQTSEGKTALRQFITYFRGLK